MSSFLSPTLNLLPKAYAQLVFMNPVSRLGPDRQYLRTSSEDESRRALMCLWTMQKIFFCIVRQWLLASGCSVALGRVVDRVPYGVPSTALGLVEMLGPMGCPTYNSTSSPLLKSESKGL